MVAFPANAAHDAGNPVSNVDGTYVQVYAERPEGFVPVTVTSVTPNEGDQGVATAVTIAGTGFLASPTVTVSGTKVAVSDVVRVSATEITATFTAEADAGATARTVTVRNADTGTDVYDADTTTFTVTTP